MTASINPEAPPADAMTTPTDPGHSSGDTSIFGGLPNELLTHIFESVAGDHRYSTLYSLALVNRHFNSIAIPVLYSEYHDCCDSHLVPFAHTLFTTPALALFVQELTYRVWHFTPAQDSSCCARLKSGKKPDYGIIANPALAIFRGFQLASTWLYSTYEKDFCKSYSCESHHDIILFCLSTLCLNLSSWGIQGGHCLFNCYEAMEEIRAIPPTHLFQNLRTITLDKWTCGLPNTCTSDLFILPSMRRLVIDREIYTMDQYTHDPPWNCPPGASSITELIFTKSYLPGDFIATAIRSCKELKVFHYEHWDWDDERLYECGSQDICIDEDLLDAFSHHKRTLRDLRWSVLRFCKVHSEEQRAHQGAMPLAEYTSLKRLEFPLHLFPRENGNTVISDALPPDLESIKLDVRSVRDGFTDRFFIALCNASRDYMTSLTQVEVDCRIDVDHLRAFLPLHPCNLKRMFSSLEISFEYSLEFMTCGMDPVWQEQLPNEIQEVFGEGDGDELALHTRRKCGCHELCSYAWKYGDRNLLGARYYEDAEVTYGHMGGWVGPREFEQAERRHTYAVQPDVRL